MTNPQRNGGKGIRDSRREHLRGKEKKNCHTNADKANGLRTRSTQRKERAYYGRDTLRGRWHGIRKRMSLSPGEHAFGKDHKMGVGEKRVRIAGYLNEIRGQIQERICRKKLNS